MRRSLLGRAGALGLLLSTAAPPAAAIVNVEDLRVEDPPPGFSGQLAFASTSQSGNTDKATISLGTRLQWAREDVVDFVVMNYDYGETNDVEDTDKGFLHARHVATYAPGKAWELFAQIERNDFTRLSFRGLVGGGLRWTFRPGEEGRFAVVTGAGAFRSREELEDTPDTTDAGIDDRVRANLYLILKYRINDSVRVASTTYYQPATNETRDFRALEQAALLVKLSDRLDLKIALDVVYDSRPPQRVQSTDTSLRTGIEFRF